MNVTHASNAILYPGILQYMFINAVIIHKLRDKVDWWQRFYIILKKSANYV